MRRAPLLGAGRDAGEGAVRICSPHCGIDPETTSGGETYERELLRHLGALGHAVELLLARHKRYPDGVPNWTVHRLPVGRGLRWPVAALLLPPYIRRLYDQPRFDLLRAHSLRFIGPAALIARRRYRLDVPIVAHHHHLDRNWLNPLIEGRVMRAVERVVVGSEFAIRQAAAELGVAREQFSVVPYGVDRRFRRAPKPAALLAQPGLDGEGGFLVDPSDHDAFVRKTLLLCADPMLRKKLGAANGERVDRLYRWDHCAAATTRVYEEVLERWRRGGGMRGPRP